MSSTPERDVQDMTASELEAYFLADSDLPSFEQACRAVARDGPPEERHTMVVTRRPFWTTIEGEERPIPSRSYLIGPADFTANVPKHNRDGLGDGLTSLVGPRDDPAPLVRGDVFGRDETVVIVAEMTIPNPAAARSPER